MSQLQPGTGYTFSASSSGTTIDVNKPFIQYDDTNPEAGLSVAMIDLYPFKIQKGEPSSTGDWADLLVYLAQAAIELDFTFTFIPETGSTFTVLPGTINGTVVSLEATSCAVPTLVYVQSYPEGSEQIVTSPATTPLVDDDTASYLLIGEVSSAGKTQYVKNSLVMERFKCGDNDARYWYSKI